MDGLTIDQEYTFKSQQEVRVAGLVRREAQAWIVGPRMERMGAECAESAGSPRMGRSGGEGACSTPGRLCTSSLLNPDHALESSRGAFPSWNCLISTPTQLNQNPQVGPQSWALLKISPANAPVCLRLEAAGLMTHFQRPWGAF